MLTDKAHLTVLRMLIIIGVLLVISDFVKADTVWVLDAHDINDVYDGDTFYIDLAGLPPIFGDRLPVRLKNIDTPELRSRCKTEELKDEEKRLGRLAGAFVTEQLMNADEIRVINLERGSFFRVVADVFVDGVWLNELMVESGHAVTAFDGKSADWCDIIQSR